MNKILVSECLYGECIVRYDGKGVPLLNHVFLGWKAEGRLLPVCPEVCGGLATPRPPAQRRNGGVFTQTGADVTDAYRLGAETALRLALDENVCFCILKDGSPSCGSKKIYDGTFSGRKIPGHGLTAELLRNAGFTIFTEHELADAAELLAKTEKLDLLRSE